VTCNNRYITRFLNNLDLRDNVIQTTDIEYTQEKKKYIHILKIQHQTTNGHILENKLKLLRSRSLMYSIQIYIPPTLLGGPLGPPMRISALHKKCI
jgi:hypothetical protein